MRARAWCPSILLATLGACAGGSNRIPTPLHDLPWVGASEADRLAIEARTQFEFGRDLAALASAEAAIDSTPRHVDAHRIRQDLLRRRGRIGRLLHEAEQRLVEWGSDDARATYLYGRVQRSDADKRRAFERATELDPHSFWGWHGLAFSFRDDDRDHAIALYSNLLDATEGHPLVATALASVLRQAGEIDAAIAIYERLRQVPSAMGIGELGLAETHLQRGDRARAWAPLLTALRERPADPGVRRLVAGLLASGLPGSQVEQLLDVLYEDPTRLAAFGRGDGAAVLASLLERRGNLPAARESLAAPDAATTAASRRHVRRAMLMVGDVAGFLRALRADLPLAIVRDERSQVRGRWSAVLDGGWFAGRDGAVVADPLADAAQAVDLCRALLGCGLVFEADVCASLALARHRDEPALMELRAEARRELAFEGALRRILYQGYAHSNRDDGAEPPDLAKVIEDLRQVSLRIFGADVVGTPRTFGIPLVGELMDPFVGRLAEHLDRYNRHLVLGQRWSGAVEGLLMTRLSLRELEDSTQLPLRGRCLEVVGDDRQVQTISGVLGGDLAGVALLDHYVIDYDAVRDWAQSIRERRAIVREDDLALLRDPLPAKVDRLEPVDVAWRLVTMSPVEDTALDLAVFDMICAHERTHLVDSFYYLPPASNLWRVLGLVIAHGFSPLSIESEMEGRAEAGALVVSEHTELVLAHIADFLESESEESPHAVGFRRLAERICDELARFPDTADNSMVSRWHLVPRARMREVAERALER